MELADSGSGALAGESPLENWWTQPQREGVTIALGSGYRVAQHLCCGLEQPWSPPWPPWGNTHPAFQLPHLLVHLCWNQCHCQRRPRAHQESPESSKGKGGSPGDITPGPKSKSSSRSIYFLQITGLLHCMASTLALWPGDFLSNEGCEREPADKMR